MSDRKHLIRIAAALPAGDATRRVILSELQKQGGGTIGDPGKWIPSRVKNQLSGFARILKDVPLETRALAGSVDLEDAYYDIIEMLEWGKGPRKEPVEKDKRTYNKLEALESDMWFEDWLDHIVDSVEEDWGIDEDELRNRVQQELSLQLVKAGILGKRAKRGALQKRAVWSWVSMAIDDLLKTRHETDAVPPGTFASLFKSLDKRERAKVRKADHAWIKGMASLIASTHGAEERSLKRDLEGLLWEELFDRGREYQMDNWSGNRDWNDDDEKDLLDEFFKVVAKL